MKRFFVNGFKNGFTLVELMVIAPVVILIIGGFIGLIVNLTGEVMVSRGANMLTYNVQDALNRIEQDVKLSSTFLANTDSALITTTKQGYGGTTAAGSTTNFTNITKSGGSSASLILNAIATSSNPLDTTAKYVYLKDQPNACTPANEMYKNKPLTYTVVYFVDTSNTLWRRVIMPLNYDNTTTTICAPAPWQLPTCISGYTYSGSSTYCKSNDEKLIEGVTPANFSFNYYSIASSTTPDSTAGNASVTNDATRATALLSTPTVEVTVTATQTIAGRTVTKTSTMRASRLDANASGVAQEIAVTSAPTVLPTPSGQVSNGHVVTFTWPQVAGATGYNARYNINGGTWSAYTNDISNTSRTYVVSAGNHTDTINVEVYAKNSYGVAGTPGTRATNIPLWAPLPLQNGWTDHSSTYSPAGYTKTSTGYVLIRGLIKNPSVPSADDVIASLPDDYKPNGRLIFPTVAPGDAKGRVDVWAEGTIKFNAGSGVAGDWITLDVIRYLAASAPAVRTAPTLLNSWVNYGGSFAPATYAQDSMGRVYIEGLVKSGVITNETNIFTLPAGLAPPQYMNVAERLGGNTSAYIGISASSPSVRARGQGTNAYHGLNVAYLPSGTGTWNNLTLQNSWVNYGGSYTTAQYAKTSDNVVQLKGFIKSGVTSQNTIVATLPANYRPNYRIIINTAFYGSNCRIDILTTGPIQITYCTDNTWISLDGINFVAEQ